MDEETIVTSDPTSQRVPDHPFPSHRLPIGFQVLHFPYRRSSMNFLMIQRMLQITQRHPLWLATILMTVIVSPVSAQSFRSDSKRFGNSKMDIVLTETERQARTSVVDIHITAIGSSVGSSFFLLCSVRDLAKKRGNYRYIAKREEQPRHGQMLIGFLTSATEPPERLDPRLAGQPVIDLEYFAPICDKMQ